MGFYRVENRHYFKKKTIYKNRMLLFASWLQFIPFRVTAICTSLFLYLIIYVWWAVVPQKFRDVGMWVAWENC